MAVNQMQVSADLQKAIVFFGQADPPSYGGTGFLLNYRTWSWLVTARHVAEPLKDGPFWIRGNWANEKHHDPLPGIWHGHPDDGVDVAVTPLHLRSIGVGNIPQDALLTEAERPFYEVELGNFAYTVGLFRPLPGERRALSVVHTGFIARLPDEHEPLKRKALTPGGPKLNCAAYLVQSPHLSGLSGSPVFVRRTSTVPGDDGAAVAAGGVALLGLWSGGYYGEPMGDLKIDLGPVSVAAGFGIVIPAERIVETIDDHLANSLPKLVDATRSR